MTPVYGSLFTGVGGFDLGFEAAGWHCAWMVEIDPVCQAVLRRHWPDVPKFLDVRDCGAANLTPVDAIIFGSPCQDLSVAGLRAGFEGERSGLFHEAIRIIRELRPTWAVWENVVGSLSSVRGRDFGTALDALADSGALDICWRVLDAQFWGVAQRRRRVFVVADFRGERAGEILFESESVRGDSQTRGEAREAVAGTLGGGAGSRGWAPDTDRMTFVVNGNSTPETAHERAFPLRADDGSGNRQAIVAHTLTAPDPNAAAKNGKRQDGSRYDRDAIVAASLALRGREGGATAELGGEQATALRASQGGGDKPHVLVSGAVSSKRAKGTGGPPVDEAYNLVAAPLTASYGKQVDSSDTSKGPPNAIVAPLTASYGHHGRSSPCGDGSEPLVAAWDGVGITSKTNRSSVVPGAPAPTRNGSGLASLASPAAVRRLTPTECEKLQGWPPNHTSRRDDGTAIADGPRYRMIGNGVVAPLARWLAERLAAAQKEGYPPERSLTTPNVPPPRPTERSPGSQPFVQPTPNAAAPDHPNRSGPDLDGALADRGSADAPETR